MDLNSEYNYIQDEYQLRDSYLGNQLIKRHGVVEKWNKEKLVEYHRCSTDPLYFIENYMKIITLDYGLQKIKLYDFQKDMIQTFHDERYTICLLPRQSSKTTSVVSYLLWYTLFNSDKVVAILANKGATAKEILARYVLALENIPFFLQPGCKVLNKNKVLFSNNTKIIAAATSSSSIRGESVNCITGDSVITIQNELGEEQETTMEMIYANPSIAKFDNTYLVDDTKIQIDIKETKYERWYRQIIENAKNRTEILEYSEKHHVIPRSLGGDNSKENIVTLSLREHFICHKLLVKMNSGKNKHKMLHALFCMSATRRISLPSKLYAEAKEAMIKGWMKRPMSEVGRISLSEKTKARWQNSEWRKSFLEARAAPGGANEKMSIALTGRARDKELVNRVNKNPEKIRKTAEKHRGMKRTNETKINQSESKQRLISKIGKEEFSKLIGKGQIYIHNCETGEVKRIKKEDYFEYPWLEGSGKNHNTNTRYMYRPGVDTKSIRVKESETEEHLNLGYTFGMLKKEKRGKP
jgi:hypothetical protein